MRDAYEKNKEKLIPAMQQLLQRNPEIAEKLNFKKYLRNNVSGKTLGTIEDIAKIAGLFGLGGYVPHAVLSAGKAAFHFAKSQLPEDPLYRKDLDRNTLGNISSTTFNQKYKAVPFSPELQYPRNRPNPNQQMGQGSYNPSEEYAPAFVGDNPLKKVVSKQLRAKKMARAAPVVNYSKAKGKKARKNKLVV